jgi:hypothetical protein
VVARLQFNLAEEISPLELVKKVINPRNGVVVSDCDFVSGSIINAKLPSSVLLLHQYNRASARGGVGSDVPLLKKLLDLMLDFLILHQRASID